MSTLEAKMEQILSNQSDLKLILANQLEIQSLIREAIKNQSALATIQQTQARIIQNQMDIAAGISEHKTAEGKILDNQSSILANQMKLEEVIKNQHAILKHVAKN